MAQVSVIGSGFAGLASACFAAKEGHSVTIFEKNELIGGRARVLRDSGFTFDMGPSWYWMPDVFDRFFAHFGKKTSDYYKLVQLDPGFQMIFGQEETLIIPKDKEALYAEFEKIEPGGANNLKKYLADATYKYDVGMGKMVYNPSFSWLEYATWDVVKSAAKLNMFSSVSTHVRKYFKDKRLIALMEFPSLFLGAVANQIPALYSLMNHAALTQGTWYPMGGMAEIIKAMEQLALSLGVEIKTNCNVTQIRTDGRQVTGLLTSIGDYDTDGVIAAADYNHVEQKLLSNADRNYAAGYWEKKTFAPSSLIFYLGVNKKIKRLIHHNLFFDTSLDQHAHEIYKQPQWPTAPLFYVCCPSKTDPSVAPENMDNLFILMPLAPGIEDTQQLRKKYFDIIIGRMEKLCNEPIEPFITYSKGYCISDFITDYNAYKGNAYGLANTLNQTAVLKPALNNKKISNLFYAGQLTVPGPGVPPALISGQLAAEQLMKNLKTSDR